VNLFYFIVKIKGGNKPFFKDLQKKIPNEDVFTTPSGDKDFMQKINYSVVAERTTRKPRPL
jgi:hypothetical protein